MHKRAKQRLDIAVLGSESLNDFDSVRNPTWISLTWGIYLCVDPQWSGPFRTQFLIVG